jgi:energy-converting hydrogenase Eha subunit A
MMATRVTVTMAATRPLITMGTPLRTMADTPRATMPRPIMVLGTGVLSVPHTHITAALGTIVGIVAIGDRRRDDALRQ